MYAFPVPYEAWRSRLWFGVARANKNGVEDGLSVAGHKLDGLVSRQNSVITGAFGRTLGKKYHPAKESRFEAIVMRLWL